MQKNKFNTASKLIIGYAGEYATSLNSNFVDIEHFLLGIIKEGNSFSSKLLSDFNITESKMITYIKIHQQSNLIQGKTIDLSSDATTAIENALICANFSIISPDHLLMGILKNPSKKIFTILNTLKVSYDSIFHEISKKIMLPNYISIKTDKKRTLESRILNQYGKELVSLAHSKVLDPVVGREKEIESLICVLSRRRKNNPAIVGDAGVGKTALIEGLAHKIASGDVPHNLQNKRIVSLDLSAVIAGTKYRGEFEDRVKSITDECIKLQDVILFIDELHIIMGTGGAEGAIDAANILKPALSRGQIQIIGATTFEEFRKTIEKDAALERRFQKITINEPTSQETTEIIRGIRRNFEHFHKVAISDQAIDTAVSLSVRYMSDRKLPDKAIDLIDEACASFNLSAKRELNKYKVEISDSISDLDIQKIVSKYTGIESFNLDSDTAKSIEFLEKSLETSIIGQNDACKKIVSAIKRSKVGINDPNRPIGSFIFLGPTGVGKTEICKALAYGLFKTEKAIIKVDMSEFMDKSSITKLIGASAGYVGYGEQTAILEQIRNKPYSIVLFDEIEKAHPDILNLLLQILEEGVLTDSLHRKINFKNTIIIMTSNIGAEKITNKNLGFLHNQNIKTDALNELRKLFKPELLNRIDEIVVFNKLSLEDICKITRNMLINLQRRALKFGISVEFSDKSIEHIAKTGYSELYGARPIRRLITECIENPLTDKIINGDISKGDSVCIDFENEIHFTKN